ASVPLDLPFNLDGVSSDTNRADGDFDGKGKTLAAEMLPQKLQLDGLWFKFGPSGPGALNVLVPKGQSVPVSLGSYNRIYILATAVGGDVLTTIAGEPVTIREWQGPIGQWDSRLKEPRQLREVQVAQMTPGQSWTPSDIEGDLVVSYDPSSGIVSGIDQIRRGFVKRDEIAWIGTHRHAPEGNEPYIPSYLFAYAIDLPKGARAVRLPNNDHIRILAMTAAREPFRLWPTTALYATDLPNRCSDLNTSLQSSDRHAPASPLSMTKTAIPGLRWWIIGLVFLATLINFIDRLTISVLAPVITAQLELSNLEFASITTSFLAAYTISQGLSGKLYDRIGTKRGFTLSILVWSLAACAHAFARGLISLISLRLLLGVGEAGNWPGAAKVIAEWFPVRERAFAMGIFNSGVAIGNIVAPPLIVFLQIRF